MKRHLCKSIVIIICSYFYRYWKPGQPDWERDDPANGYYSNAASDCVEYYDGSVSGDPDRGWEDRPCSTGHVTYWMCETIMFREKL